MIQNSITTTVPTAATVIQYVVNKNDLENIIKTCLKEAVAAVDAERKDTLIKKKEACKLLGVTDATLWRWEKLGYIKPRRLGSKVYFSKFELDNMKGGAAL